MWLVNPSKVHDTDLEKMGLKDKASIMQIKLDTNISNGSNTFVDINFIEKEYFKECIENADIDLKFEVDAKNKNKEYSRDE